jgi:hypothetical protein
MYTRLILLFLLVAVYTQNYPGSVTYSENNCRGGYIATQYIPDQCFNSSSGQYFKETCDSAKRTSISFCRDDKCSVGCQDRTVPVRCTDSASNICSPLFSTRTEGVTGSMYELNRCGGAVKGYVKTSGQECVSDVKLYCDRTKNIIMYEKYQYDGCRGEMTLRQFTPGQCVMGVIYSIFMKLDCN